jgi:hypothetical protein
MFVDEYMHIVPYGIEKWSSSVFSEGSLSSDNLPWPVPFVSDARQTIRLYDLNYNFSSMNLNHNEADTILLLENYFTILCSPWDQVSKNFIKFYFSYTQQKLSEAEGCFLQRLEKFKGLFKREDWFYSALAPLPRAHLYAPSNPDVPFGDERDFVNVSFAFCTKSARVALLGPADSLTPKAKQEKIRRMKLANITIYEMKQDDITPQLINQILGQSEREFWMVDDLPRGPFPALGLHNY